MFLDEVSKKKINSNIQILASKKYSNIKLRKSWADLSWRCLRRKK